MVTCLGKSYHFLGKCFHFWGSIITLGWPQVTMTNPPNKSWQGSDPPSPFLAMPGFSQLLLRPPLPNNDDRDKKLLLKLNQKWLRGRCTTVPVRSNAPPQVTYNVCHTFVHIHVQLIHIKTHLKYEQVNLFEAKPQAKKLHKIIALVFGNEFWKSEPIDKKKISSYGVKKQLWHK